MRSRNKFNVKAVADLTTPGIYLTAADAICELDQPAPDPGSYLHD